MSSRTKLFSNLALSCAIGLIGHAANAQAPASVSARLDGDHWLVSVHPAAGGYGLTIDGKAVSRSTNDSYALAKLPHGLHKVEIAGAPPLHLLIQDPGTKSHDPATQTQTIAISVPKSAKGRPAPTFRVKQGDLVRLDWTSLTPAEVHLHGYDIEGRVGPSAPLSMMFEASLAGRFPAETHGKTGGPVAFLEVYPR